MMRSGKGWKPKKKAEMGVGEILVFTATILVLVIASSVLMTSANKVSEQSQSTRDTAFGNIASGFTVQDITGHVLADGSAIHTLFIQVKLQAGSPSVNLDRITIQFIGNSSQYMMQISNSTNSSGHGIMTSSTFSAYQVLAQTTGGSTWTAGHYVVQQGDMIMISISNDAGNLNLKPSQPATIKIIPAYGSSTTVNFVTPSLFKSDYVNLK